MKENTRRELLKRLPVIAAVSATGYVAPKMLRIDTAAACHNKNHTGSGGGCT